MIELHPKNYVDKDKSSQDIDQPEWSINSTFKFYSVIDCSMLNVELLLLVNINVLSDHIYLKQRNSYQIHIKANYHEPVSMTKSVSILFLFSLNILLICMHKPNDQVVHIKQHNCQVKLLIENLFSQLFEWFLP